MTNEPLGIILGGTTPSGIEVEAKNSVPVGEFVTFEHGKDNEKILGLVTQSVINSDLLNPERCNCYETALDCKKSAFDNERDKGYRLRIRVIGYISKLNEGRMVIPGTPADPGTEIHRSSIEDLDPIIAPSNICWIEVGTLLRNEAVAVKVHIDKVTQRHLAILAMTGMGKTNLLLYMAKELAKNDATMIIFDSHGDYTYLDITNIKHIDSTINPRFINLDEFAEILGIADNATNQLHVLRAVFIEDVTQKTGFDFWQALKDALTAFEKDRRYAAAAAAVKDKIDDARLYYQNILDAGINDALSQIKDGMINVVNLVELPESLADVAVSFYLRALLNERKKATLGQQRSRNGKSRNQYLPRQPNLRFPTPVLVAIEEAHIYIPAGKENVRQTKYITKKISKEGRKYGLGLVLISQRPRELDPGVLSQMGSLAIMKMVQQDDLHQIETASEALTKDLLEQITSLNPGEAILSGQWITIPTFTKIYEVKDREVGVDVRAMEQWRGRAEEKMLGKREKSDIYIPDGYIQGDG